MTQAITPKMLVVRFSSMAVPETIDAAPTGLRGSGQEQIAQNALLLMPGEPSQILISLENPTDRPIHWQLNASGDYPADWCRWQQSESQELAAHQSLEVTLSFKVPDDFFEQQAAVTPAHPRLQSDYQTELVINQISGANHHPIAYQIFTLHVRPRSFYLKFLPAFYQEFDFFRRFLFIFEQTFDPYIQTIDALWAHLDPLTAPEPLLPFLAHWVAWQLEPDWGIEQQRQLIRNAIELYRWHGTRYGLQFYLHLYTGLPLDEQHIQIEEVFTGGFAFGDCQIGQNAMMGGGRPYHFVVRLCPETPDQLIDESVVRKVIEREKPPFCTYDLDIDRREAIAL